MKITEQEARQHIIDLLEYIGEDPNREGLQGTPDRMLKMFKEIFRGYDPAQKPTITTFANGRDGIVYDDMIIDQGEFYSLCEHHCRTIFGQYYFAYIPNEKGRILGLSKIGRVVDYCASRLQIQERLARDIVNMLLEALGDDPRHRQHVAGGTGRRVSATRYCAGTQGPTHVQGEPRCAQTRIYDFQLPARRLQG